MHLRSLLLITAALTLAICPLSAATPDTTNLVVTVSGTLNPNLNSGPDCLTLASSSATVVATVNQAEKPRKQKGRTATYAVPAGGISATFGSTTFTNTVAWKMTYVLGRRADLLVLAGAGSNGYAYTLVSSLPTGSFSKRVLGADGHPGALAKTDSLKQPSSFLGYENTGAKCATTKLGLTGTIGTTR